MMNTPLLRMLSLAAALALVVPGGASAGQDDGAELPEFRATDNLELVAQIPGGGGTDLEFFTRTLDAYEDASGKLIEVSEPVERHFALVGNSSSGPKVVDITDPERPYIAAVVPSCSISQGDTQVTADGMVAAIAKQGGGTCRTQTGLTLVNGSALVDLSDVYDPVVVGRATESAGSHNNTIHPSGDYLYISTSSLTPNSGTNARIPIFDITDPANPVKIQDFLVPGNGPHDIRFSHDGSRAYLAGVSQFYILNTEDPRAPSVISVIVPPGGSIGHDTLITRDKRFLFLGDEGGGGGTYPCPGGAIYAYDLTDERAPVLLGAAEAGGGPVVARNHEEVPGPATTGGCTSHVMHLNPDGRSLTIGWYRLGSRIFDFSSFYNSDGTPKAAAGIAAAWGEGTGLVETGWIIPQGANTWSAKQYEEVPGYVFSDDTSQGFYVSRIRGVAPGRAPHVASLSATRSGGDVSVSGIADFGGQSHVSVATDPIGDAPGGLAALGIDATDLSIRVVDATKPAVEFRVKVTEMNQQPPQEIVRYLWKFRVNGTEYWVQAKRSDVTGGTTTADDPQGTATRPLGSFRLRGNCQTIQVLNTCVHLAWLDGEFDVNRDEVRMWLPLGITPDIAPGAVIQPMTMTASIQVGLSNEATSDTVTQEDPYTIPSPELRLGTAPAGTDPALVDFAAEVAPAADGSFSRLLPAVPEGHAVYARVCYGGRCDVASQVT